jgi:hypothetical protein
VKRKHRSHATAYDGGIKGDGKEEPTASLLLLQPQTRDSNMKLFVSTAPTLLTHFTDISSVKRKLTHAAQRSSKIITKLQTSVRLFEVYVSGTFSKYHGRYISKIGRSVNSGCFLLFVGSKPVSGLSIF